MALRHIALLAVLLLAAPAHAQAGSYDLRQEDGTWIHTHVLEINGSITYAVQEGLTFVSAEPAEAEVRLAEDVVNVTAGEAGNVALRFEGPAFIRIPQLGAATLAIVTEDSVAAPREAVARDGPVHEFDARPGEVYAVLAGPTATETTTVTPAPTDGATPGLDYMALVLGLLAGVLLWAFLVQRGMVQRRSRKQVVTEASHTTVAAEGPEVLEARRRTLMASLKDLEKARMHKEVSDAAYEKLKAELKKQLVTVMRAQDIKEA